MPALDNNSIPTRGDWGIYYCDANDVNGEWCWEMDIIEANMYANTITPHSCDQAPGTPTSSCDGGGCGTNSYYENNSGFCPSSLCVINTQIPFHYSIKLNSNSYHVTMSQHGQKFEYDVCGDQPYLKNMVQALDFGMVLIMSYWGTDYNTMNWLDGPTGCTGDCDTTGTVTFSDISISKDNGDSVTVDKNKWKKVNTDKFELKENSNVNSIKGHKFKIVEGKYGTKARLSVPDTE